MTNESDIEVADRLSRRRARMLPVLAVIFITQQSSFFISQVEDGARTVDRVGIGAWLILSVVLLLALTTNGFWSKPRAIRALLDDEVTRANRANALRVGFIAAMLAGLTLYVITLFEPVNAREAIHVVMTVGLAAALLSFGAAERRAHRGG